MLKKTVVIGVSAAAIAFGITAAQAAKKGPAQHSAASLACSEQANAKGLHGKVRKKFREACKRQYGKQQGYGYRSEKSFDSTSPQQGQAYKPMQDQGYKSQPSQGYSPKGQGYNPQGQGSKPKWW